MLDSRNQPPFDIVTRNADGKRLHTYQAGAAADISNRASRAGYICDDFGIRSQFSWHRTFAGEYQGAIVGLQILFAYTEVQQKSGMDRPTLREHWFHVGTVCKRDA